MNALNIAGILVAAILLVWGVLFLGQIWGEWLEWTTFFKLTVSAAVTVAVIGIVALIIRELGRQKRLKDDGYLD
ncbi:hypothetical protein [Nitratifractor sp.]